MVDRETLSIKRSERGRRPSPSRYADLQELAAVGDLGLRLGAEPPPANGNCVPRPLADVVCC